MAETPQPAPESGGVRLVVQIPRVPVLDLPDTVVRELACFLLDKSTGNVVLNVKDGRVLGLHITRLVPI